MLILLGLTVTIGSATSDAYLHRGTGDDGVVVRQPTGRAPATNADLRPLNPAARDRALGLLSDAGYRYIRQEISWAQIEPLPGEFEWTATQEVVSSITARGLVPVMVFVDTHYWARSP